MMEAGNAHSSPTSGPALKREVEARTAEIADAYGPDVDEALCRYEQAGSSVGGDEAKLWVSVAFALGRLRRFTLWSSSS